MLKKSYLFFLLFSTMNSYLFAQKASDVQTNNLLVSNIKVDGKSTDWATPLQASNKNTGLEYTIANDAQTLYVIMQAKNVNDIRKILLGGITFSMNQDGKKKTKTVLSLTYPVVTRESRRGTGGGGQRGGGSGPRLERTPQQRDSILLARNQAQLEKAKDIKVFGFKNVTDSLISIYNEYSIKAAAGLSEDGIYTYELAIPLVLIPLNMDKEFGYNVKVNGMQLNLPSNISSQPNAGNQRGPGGGRNSADFQAYLSPTDFWGKYSIAK